MDVLMFPGQGSQRVGMGADLFDTIAEFGSVEAEINALLGYSVRAICLTNPGDRLRDTRYTQPCLFVVNALHWYRAQRDGRRPGYLAGHSLGEYNALHAAGAFDFLTGVKLVKKRGELMSRARNGGMAAIVGPSADEVLQILRDNHLDQLDVANFNSATQTVISGSVDQIREAAPIFEAAKVELYFPLPVSAAFHSRFMTDASREFGAFLEDFEFSSLALPVISNVTGDTYPANAASASIRSLLTKQIVNPVRWHQGVQTMLRAGASTFFEAGPGDVLTKLVAHAREREGADS